LSGLTIIKSIIKLAKNFYFYFIYIDIRKLTKISPSFLDINIVGIDTFLPEPSSINIKFYGLIFSLLLIIIATEPPNL